MRIFKILIKTISILFGLFVLIIIIALMGESYEIINKKDSKLRFEVKKVFGIRISEAAINSEGFYHGEGKGWNIFDGKLKQEGKWSNGFWHGLWKTYDKNGNIKMIREFKEGKLKKIIVLEGGTLQEVPKDRWPKYAKKLQQDKPVKAKID